VPNSPFLPDKVGVGSDPRFLQIRGSQARCSMTIKVGCFALVDPFSLLDHQLERVAELGFK
jgi:hypothetical protein